MFPFEINDGWFTSEHFQNKPRTVEDREKGDSPKCGGPVLRTPFAMTITTDGRKGFYMPTRFPG